MQLINVWFTILEGSGGVLFQGKNESLVSETALLVLWRHLNKNVKILLNHLLTVLNIDFRILDNLIPRET